MSKIKTRFMNKEFLLFLVIGGVNTFSGMVLALIYNRLFNPNISFVLGYSSGLVVSYVLNSLVTFKERLHIVKFVKFCITYIPNFIIQYVVVYLIYNVFEADKLIAYAFAAIIAIPVTFVLIKMFTFKN